jgi:hypothetical protein
MSPLNESNKANANTDASVVNLENAAGTAQQDVSAAGAAHVNLTQIGTATYVLGQNTMANSAPVTLASDQPSIDQSQVDTDSIWSFAIKSINMAISGSNNPLVLLRNPNASGKTIYIKSIVCSVITTNVQASFCLFYGPTITANGTVGTARSNTIGSGASAVLLVNTLSTISVSGTLIAAQSLGQNSHIVDLCKPGPDYIKLSANQNLLLTGDPSSNNRLANIQIVWREA